MKTRHVERGLRNKVSMKKKRKEKGSLGEESRIYKFSETLSLTVLPSFETRQRPEFGQGVVRADVMNTCTLENGFGK